MNRVILETPKSVVDNGRIRNGIFQKPFDVMNIREATVPEGPLKQFRHRIKLKEWLGFGISHPDWFLTAFMVDAKYVATSNFYAFDRNAANNYKHERVSFNGKTRVAENLNDGRSIFTSKGFRIEFQSRVSEGEHRIKISIKKTLRNPSVEIDVTLAEDLSRIQPLIASLPLIEGHHAFTHKAIMPASGWAKIGKEEIIFDPARDFAIMDEHKSHLPWLTEWRWTTFGGYDKKGRLVGLNLGDHDTISDQRAWNENCLWVDEKMYLLGPVEFDFNPRDYMKPWRIREVDGRGEFTFIPEGDKNVNFNIGLIGMNYFQPCGRAEGYVTGDSGERIEFDNFYGVAEMMDARW